MSNQAPALTGPQSVQGVLVIGCGALVRELQQVAEASSSYPIAVECLPAKLHNRPERIAPAVRERIRRARATRKYRKILVGYMDCGTSGDLDKVCEAEGVSRLPGAHCYELYAGSEMFAALHDDEPGTFYLTDYLVRNFDRLIMDGLGISDHPELLEMYFGNYKRVMHLAQSHDLRLNQAAMAAAARLGLAYERRYTGIGGLGSSIVRLAEPATSQSSRTMSTHLPPLSIVGLAELATSPVPHGTDLQEPHAVRASAAGASTAGARA